MYWQQCHTLTEDSFAPPPHNRHFTLEEELERGAYRAPQPATEDLPLRRPSGVLCCFITVIERETGAEQNSVLCCRGPGYIMHSSSLNISSTDPRIFLKAPVCFSPILFAQPAIRHERAAVARKCHAELKLRIAPIKRELLRADEGSDGNAVRRRNSISANAPSGIVFDVKRMHPIPRATNSYISIERSFTPQIRWLNAEACHFVEIHRIPSVTPWSFLPVKSNWWRTIRGAAK